MKAAAEVMGVWVRGIPGLGGGHDRASCSPFLQCLEPWVQGGAELPLGFIKSLRARTCVQAALGAGRTAQQSRSDASACSVAAAHGGGRRAEEIPVDGRRRREEALSIPVF